MLPAHDHVVTLQPREPEPRIVTAFGELAQSAANELEEISVELRYPGETALYNEGEAVRGIFILHNGRVKIFICSGEGKTLIMRLAKPGDMLGLPAALSGKPYEVTAETIGPCQLTFLKRDHFLRFMHRHKEVCLAVADQLARIYASICHEMRCLGLSHSASGKLAKLLSEWPPSNGDTPSRIKFAFRHEEVAQMIGTSRETVSRLFVEFKKRHLVELNGSTLHIHDRAALQEIAAGRDPASRRGCGDRSDPRFHPDGV